MPCFRGIDVCLVTQANLDGLSEFPHPEASSVRVIELPNHSNDRRMSDPATSQDTELTGFLKTNPRISVYVPSIPGMKSLPAQRYLGGVTWLLYWLKLDRSSILDPIFSPTNTRTTLLPILQVGNQRKKYYELGT